MEPLSLIILRYLSREVLVTLSAISAVLLTIIMSGRFIRYLAQAAQGAIDPSVLLWIMLYRLPSFLYLILPLGLFLGILLAYGRMYLDSEMTVLTATGFSLNKLFLYTLLPTSIVAIVVAWLCFSLGPSGIIKVEHILSAQSSMTEFDTLIPGRFQSIRKGSRVTYAESLSENKKRLNNIFISQTEQNDHGEKKTTVLSAKHAVIEQQTDGSRYLILENGQRYDGNPGDLNYRVTQYDSYGILLPKPEINGDINEVNALSMTQLLTSDAWQNRVELNWRLSIPVLVFIVALLAVPLSKVNPRQGRFYKLIPAIFLYMIYLGLLIAVRGRIDKTHIAIAWLWVIHLIFLAIGLMLLYWEYIRNLFSSRTRGAKS